ncbi:MAG: hypothetical protein WDO19_23670 [Bacteroidota bacterium]
MARLTVTALLSVIKFDPTVIFGFRSTRYWKYSSSSFIVLSRFSSSWSGYSVKAFVNLSFAPAIGELPLGLLISYNAAGYPHFAGHTKRHDTA